MSHTSRDIGVLRTLVTFVASAIQLTTFRMTLSLLLDLGTRLHLLIIVDRLTDALGISQHS
jgi:hypothetical protein